MLDGEKLSGEEAYEFILKAYEEAKQLEAERKENGINKTTMRPHRGFLIRFCCRSPQGSVD